MLRPTIRPTKHDYRSFEYLDSTIVDTRTVRVITVYRPPPSAANGLTADIFLDEFGTLLEELVVTNAELLIVGDFNFHMDDLMDGNAIRFSRLLETFDLKQYVKAPTHLYGHIRSCDHQVCGSFSGVEFLRR